MLFTKASMTQFDEKSLTSPHKKKPLVNLENGKAKFFNHNMVKIKIPHLK